MLTSELICNLEGRTFKRNIRLVRVKALTKDIGRSNVKEFIIHVEDEYDYIIISKRREELMNKIKECYFKIKNKNLPIYGINGSISKYLTTKIDLQNGMERLPKTEFRLNEEDTLKPLKHEDYSMHQYDQDDDYDDLIPKPSFGLKPRTSTLFAY